MRIVLGLVAGIVAAILTVMLVERIGHLLVPPPARFASTPPAEMAAAVAALPFGAKLAVVVAWFVGALGGASLAVGLSRRAWTGWVVVGFILAGVVLTVATITHPLWMAIAGIVGPLLAGWLASRLARPVSADPALGAGTI